MEDEHTTRPCPYCAEEISAQAVRCPHCRSRLMEPARWHRDHEGRRLAGVAAGLARALALPVTPVRLAFVVLTFFHFIGAFVYVALWLVMPYGPAEEPPYVQALVQARRIYDQIFGRSGAGRDEGTGGRPRPPSPPGPSGNDLNGPVP